MTNLTLEVVKNPENLDIYEGEIKSFVNSERFLRFQLIFNQENEEIQYVPLKINIDVQNNHVINFKITFYLLNDYLKELEEEMFFDASQTDHFMALIYKLVNKDLN